MKPSAPLCPKKTADAPVGRVCFIVVAAGSGSRFGADKPKQFCLLDGRPVLMTTLDRLAASTADAEIILVLNPDFRSYWQELCALHDFTLPHMIVDGGSTRTLSVAHALHHVPSGSDAVLIHDGARPVVDAAMVGRLLSALKDGEAAIPVVPVTDSLRHITPECQCGMPVDRSEYVAVQTPQAFRAEAILSLLKDYDSGFSCTDDATMFQLRGSGKLITVAGDPRNIKITHPGDIEAAEMYLR